MRLAREKDRGFDIEMFGAAIQRIHGYERRDFPVDDALHSAMRTEFDDWWQSLAAELTRRRGIRRLRSDPEPPGLDL